MQEHQLDLLAPPPIAERRLSIDEFRSQVEEFDEFGARTIVLDFPDHRFDIPIYANEFWTAKQRDGHALHEVSYRACFKPQLPHFFISRLTEPGETVFDPHMGRGTTVLEAALLGRRAAGCDINPLSEILVAPRLDPPDLNEIRDRLDALDLESPVDVRHDLLTFYHPSTLRAITNLKRYLAFRHDAGTFDRVDRWIRMVATTRLSGHSPGFFSVYTLPPNQAVTIDAQRKINARRGQTPPDRNVRELILRKSRSLLSTLTVCERRDLCRTAADVLLLTRSCDDTPQIPDASVHLVVTSPPFLDVIDYQKDNWLRCWFNGIDAGSIPISRLRQPREWQARMTDVFRELRRVLVCGGHIAFEVGEVRGGRVQLETLVVPAAVETGLIPEMVLINAQTFTKTSNCWGVDNQTKGTNTNRIVVLRKED